MEEFAQSRYRLESRYHHVLVDEFQDTSRAQWELVSLLVQSWGEGAGLALQRSACRRRSSSSATGSSRSTPSATPTCRCCEDASRYIEALRPGGDVRRSISRSFRSVPALLAFVNDVCARHAEVRGDAATRFATTKRIAFRSTEAVIDRGRPIRSDWSPATHPRRAPQPRPTEIARLIAEGAVVRDRDTGCQAAGHAGDIAILFRTRESHREFEAALERARHRRRTSTRGWASSMPTRSRTCSRCSGTSPIRCRTSVPRRSCDRASCGSRTTGCGGSRRTLARRSLRGAAAPPVAARSGRRRDASAQARAVMRAVARAGRSAAAGRAARSAPDESAYAVELRGPRLLQARENLKKIRALIRRIQNRGYATLGRIAAHLDRLAVGDEVQRGDRRARRREPDDGPRVEGTRVSGRLPRQPRARDRQDHARASDSDRDPTEAPVRAMLIGVRCGRRLSVRRRRRRCARKRREETKRLLYVALTRARDRLYLGSRPERGPLQPGRGSLAEVLPSALVAAVRGR